ncbi:PAS domain S-box protein [Candidatus Woesearchaeota archaeon]|nr:PAS domain S-box protein [Candidatus Woesearchaeota archaeon]
MKLGQIITIGFLIITALVLSSWYLFLDEVAYGHIITIIITLVLSFTLFIAVSRCMSSSISKISSGIERITEGDFTVSMESCRIDELEDLTKSLNRILISMKLAVMRTGKGLGLKEIVKAKDEIEKKYKKSEDFVRNVLENSGIPIIGFKRADGLLIINNEFLKMTGYSEKDIQTEKELFDRAFPSKMVRDKVKEKFQQFNKGGKVEDFVLPIRRKDGSTIIVVSNLTALHDSKGNQIGEAFFLRDLSEIFDLEEQLRYWAANGFIQVPKDGVHKRKIEITPQAKESGNIKEYKKKSSRKNQAKSKKTKKSKR